MKFVKRVHMCADIQGMLNNYKRKGSLDGILADIETRKSLSDAEARIYLHECINNGWKVPAYGRL